MGDDWFARPDPELGPLALFPDAAWFEAWFAPALLEARRRLRGPRSEMSSASWSSSSSFPPEILRPPGTLAGPGGAAPTWGGMGMAAERPIGWPTGRDDGKVP